MGIDKDVLEQFIDALETHHIPYIEEGGCGFDAAEVAAKLLESPAIRLMQDRAWKEGFSFSTGRHEEMK